MNTIWIRDFTWKSKKKYMIEVVSHMIFLYFSIFQFLFLSPTCVLIHYYANQEDKTKSIPHIVRTFSSIISTIAPYAKSKPHKTVHTYHEMSVRTWFRKMYFHSFISCKHLSCRFFPNVVQKVNELIMSITIIIVGVHKFTFFTSY
jgi:hypothetical protein